MNTQKKKSIIEQREMQVRKANEIIQKSRFSLSTQQQKIVLYLISKIKPFDKEFQYYDFSIVEFCKVCGISLTGKNYNDIRQAIKAIADKSMWLDLEDENGTEALIRWIETPVIVKNTGYIKIRLNEAMKPYLLQLKENYTTYELLWTLNFKSKYSIRLYELIKSYHYHELDKYTISFSFDELREKLNSTYTNYKSFKQRVLLPAINEINAFSDKTIELEEIKEGRAHSVKVIQLTLGTKDTIERIQLHEAIQKDLGIDENQVTIWDIVESENNY